MNLNICFLLENLYIYIYIKILSKKKKKSILPHETIKHIVHYIVIVKLYNNQSYLLLSKYIYIYKTTNHLIIFTKIFLIEFQTI